MNLNYKHLHYFWVVAHEGSMAKASEKLHITPQTISGQISLLEERLGSPLFEKVGRGLQLTEMGRLVLRYADDIFELGRELTDVIRGASPLGPSEFIVGVASALPKTIVYKIIEPALKLDREVSLMSREGSVEDLLAELAIHKVDLVLSDTPVSGSFHVRAFNHLLGESGLTCFGTVKLARALRKNFPYSLNQAPTLLPTRQYAIRQLIDGWYEQHQIAAKICGQFDDSALLKAFGQTGMGVFFMSSSIEEEICRQFNVSVIGRIDAIKQKYYAISAERKVKHPAVVAICQTARQSLFAVTETQNPNIRF